MSSGRAKLSRDLDAPVLALVIFFLLYTWYCGGAGLIIVGWQDMIAKIIPVEVRGRFFGIMNFIGNGSGVLGALAVPYFLDRFAFPNGFVIAFGIAAVLNFCSWISLSLTHEPAVKSSKPHVSQVTYLKSLPEILRRDRNFRMYLLSQIINSLSGMAVGFLLVYTVKTWGLSDAKAGEYVIVMQVGLTLANLMFGFLADRKGHKLSLEICFLLNTLAVVLALLAPSPLWFFPIFFLRGAVNAGNFISGVSIVYEFTGTANRPTYIGLANTIPGLAGSIAPLIGGWLAGSVSYQAMFILAALLGATGWGMLHFGVREPRHAGPGPAPAEPAAETTQP